MLAEEDHKMKITSSNIAVSVQQNEDSKYQMGGLQANIIEHFHKVTDELIQGL